MIRDEPTPGYVYLATHATRPVVKVGMSVHPYERVRSQYLMSMVTALHTNHSRAAESFIHRLLNPWKYRESYHREWFYRDPAEKLFHEAVVHILSELAQARRPRDVHYIVRDVCRGAKSKSCERRIRDFVRRSRSRSTDQELLEMLLNAHPC